ncbi:LOW QUALITY PROTEIN: hypothetical protein ElyMa_002357600 [Elysia marginata]|uniref:Uncharacterized protein n=1 Tax=Elysia marginata TaxID=1093978 RepID=A0AAV4GBQ6_9GAST|nr:LOW QUALITY PROTEIN: hypothetical protein ElyMa_002357600 [Elysia marginata]
MEPSDIDHDDHQMQCLRATLLTTGKGRRPMLPPLTMNNRLLYQIYLLKIEGHRPGSEMEKWFKKLFPDSAYPADRFNRHVDRVAEKVSTLSETEMQQFLSRRVDFDFISDSLDQQGVTRILNKSNFKKCRVTNQMMMDLLNFFRKEKYPSSTFFETLCALSIKSPSCTSKEAWNASCKLQKEYKTLVKSKSRIPQQQLSEFLHREFAWPHDEPCQTTATSCAVATICPSTIAPSTVSKSTQTCGPRPDVIRNTEQKLLDSQKNLTSALDKIEILQDECKSLHRKNEEESRAVVCLKERVQQLEQIVRKKEKELVSAREDLCSVSESRLYKKNSALVETLKEKNLALDELEKKGQLVDGLRKDKLALQKYSSKLLKEKRELSEELKSKNECIVNLQDLMCKETAQVSTRTGQFNQFSDDMRKTVMSLEGEAGVAASKCPVVIDIVSKNLFHQTLDLPHWTTANKMVEEAHAIAKMHVAEEVLANQNVTLHSDATSRQKKKYVGQQITLDSGRNLSLGFVEVATEDAQTLLEVTTNILQELSQLMGEEDQQEVLKTMLKKVCTTMSDRASVMKSFNKKFEDFRKDRLGEEVQTNFLYCNAHYLLGLSGACEDAVKEVEGEMEEPLGRDKSAMFKNWKADESAAIRFIRTASSCLGPRGDEKSGVREEWLVYCRKERVKSQIISHRGNRFNNIFQNAEAIFILRENIAQFLSTATSGDNKKLKSVLLDAEDERIASIMCAMSIIYTHLTAPYWRLINSTTKYTQFPNYVARVVRKLSVWIEEPEQLLQSGCKGVFDDEFLEVVEDRFEEIKEYAKERKDLVVKVLKVCFEKMLVVTKRQLTEFLEDGAYAGELTATQLSQLENCPLTNLIGERAFGDLDFDMQKALLSF